MAIQRKNCESRIANRELNNSNNNDRPAQFQIANFKLQIEKQQKKQRRTASHCRLISSIRDARFAIRNSSPVTEALHKWL